MRGGGRPRGAFSADEYLGWRYEAVKPSLAFNAMNEEQWRAWRSALEAKLIELMEEWPEPCDLEPQLLERVEEEHYVREKVVFQSEPGVDVPAYVLVPKGLKPSERRPALLCAHGHGNGKDDVVGNTYGDAERARWVKETNYDYARQLALRGYVTLAPDWRGFGERSRGYRYQGRDGCDVVQLKASLLGLNPLTLNVWDAIRSIDYLETRPEVKPDRIGMVGLSYGGTVTLFTAALDQRVKAAVVSGYLNSFRAFALGLGNFCGSQVVPGLLRYGEMWDVAGLIAPRPVLVESGTRDLGFPIEAARLAFTRLKRVYEVLGVPERCEMDEFEGGHRFHGVKAVDWLAKWL
ncbi:MAG: alpha/beta fold hydrolase [Candidatus Bathyarchaeia archaeon]